MHITKPVAGGVIVATALISFFIGTYYAGTRATSTTAIGGQGAGGQARGMGGAARGGMRGGQGGGMVAGEVLSIDDTSLTVKLRDGSSKIVFYGKDSTTVQKSVSGALADVTAGINVMVMGKANADGSVTAESVQIRPAGMDRPRTQQ
ncbi:MAG: hypothetical protein WAX38_01455 [Minisyncoccia bacterium]